MMFDVAPAPPTYEEERLARLRRQMRQQDKLRFVDRDAPPVTIFIVCAWSADGWRMVTWCRGPLTGHRTAYIRKRYSRKRRFRKHDPLVFKEMRLFMRDGGCRGIAPPPAAIKRPRRKRLKEAA